MNRVAIAITGKTLWHTGDVPLWADIDLHLKDSSGNWHRRPFRVDSAPDITTFQWRVDGGAGYASRTSSPQDRR
jgi:hypothetical protein